MRYRLAFAALLLPLAGCVVPPPGPYGYPAAPYPAAAYPTPDFAYPGYAYNDGSPTLFVDGVTWPLIFWGGGWGYWDGYHRWHGAPGPVGHWLSERHPGGMGYHPYGGGPYGRPTGFRGDVGGYGPQGVGRPGGYQPGSGRPGGYQPGAFQPGAGRPGGYPSGAPTGRPGGYPSGAPGGRPPSGAPPSGAPPTGAPRGQPAASHAAPPERHRDNSH